MVLTDSAFCPAAAAGSARLVLDGCIPVANALRHNRYLSIGIVESCVVVVVAVIEVGQKKPCVVFSRGTWRVPTNGWHRSPTLTAADGGSMPGPAKSTHLSDTQQQSGTSNPGHPRAP
eukprot:scaffold12257_cov141-Isochrysis_galbana.AAC.1